MFMGPLTVLSIHLRAIKLQAARYNYKYAIIFPRDILANENIRHGCGCGWQFWMKHNMKYGLYFMCLHFALNALLFTPSSLTALMFHRTSAQIYIIIKPQNFQRTLINSSNACFKAYMITFKGELRN